ncbi:MAG TPA: hypothetical protein VNA20_10870 [Frankiaceae bacterium]|nr:hypothetical protein [Frankiaceae bacterium]
MLVRTNARMTALGPPPADAPQDPDALAPALLALAMLGFVEVEGCVVLAAYESAARATTVEAAGGETAFEAYVNHVLVDALLPPDTPPHEVLGQAVHLVRRLAADLCDVYRGRLFELVVAYGEQCTVRFHTVRPGQRRLPADLESSGDAVLVLSVP